MKYSFKDISAVCIFLLTTSVVSANSIDGQPTSAISSKMAKDVLLTDVTVAGNKVIAVGERGHIIYSDDGENWQQANVPVSVLLTSISFENETLGFVTGHDATLLKTTDGGNNWHLVNYQPRLDKPLLDVSVKGKRVVAVGAYGLYWQSNDGGETWQSEFHDELLIEDDRLFLEDLRQFEPENYEKEKQFLLSHFNNIYLSNDIWYLAGEAGLLAKSVNNGQDWQNVETDYIGSYFSMTSLPSRQLLLAGLRGNVFVSTDESKWQSITLPAPATINNLLVTEDTTYLFANSGNLFEIDKDVNVKHTLLPDGKAIMSGVKFNDQLILATEAGIKRFPLTNNAKK